MLKLSRRIEYGLLAMKYLGNSSAEGAISVREVATKYDIPEPLLAKVMQRLKRCGVVTSTKGSSGGYRATPDMMDFTLGEIIRFLEHEIAITECTSGADGCDCRQALHCDIREPLQRLNSQVISFFHSVRLRDLLTSEPIATINLRMAQPRP